MTHQIVKSTVKQRKLVSIKNFTHQDQTI